MFAAINYFKDNFHEYLASEMPSDFWQLNTSVIQLSLGFNLILAGYLETDDAFLGSLLLNRYSVNIFLKWLKVFIKLGEIGEGAGSIYGVLARQAWFQCEQQLWYLFICPSKISVKILRSWLFENKCLMWMQLDMCLEVQGDIFLLRSQYMQ